MNRLVEIGRILGVGLLWTGLWFDIQGNVSVEMAMANARQKYREHYPAVEAGLPKDRLLKYELGSGWEPLCDFPASQCLTCLFRISTKPKLWRLHLVHSSTELWRMLFDLAAVMGHSSALVGLCGRRSTTCEDAHESSSILRCNLTVSLFFFSTLDLSLLFRRNVGGVGAVHE